MYLVLRARTKQIMRDALRDHVRLYSELAPEAEDIFCRNKHLLDLVQDPSVHVPGQRIGFLTLPTEIRLRIYDSILDITYKDHCKRERFSSDTFPDVLDVSEVCHFDSQPSKRLRKISSSWRTASLKWLFTCGTVHREGLHKVLDSHILNFRSYEDLQMCLPLMRNTVKVYLSFSDGPSHATSAALYDLRNLDNLKGIHIDTRSVTHLEDLRIPVDWPGFKALRDILLDDQKLRFQEFVIRQEHWRETLGPYRQKLVETTKELEEALFQRRRWATPEDPSGHLHVNKLRIQQTEAQKAMLRAELSYHNQMIADSRWQALAWRGRLIEQQSFRLWQDLRARRDS